MYLVIVSKRNRVEPLKTVNTATSLLRGHFILVRAKAQLVIFLFKEPL